MKTLKENKRKKIMENYYDEYTEKGLWTLFEKLSNEVMRVTIYDGKPHYRTKVGTHYYGMGFVKKLANFVK